MEFSDGAKQRRIGVVLTYVNVAVTMVITVIYTPLMLRYLGSSEYGVYTLASSIIGYLAMLDLGLGSALTRFTVKYRASGDTKSEETLRGVFFLLYLGIGAVAFICGMILYFNLGVAFGESFTADELSKLKTVFLLMTVNLAFSFPLGVVISVVSSYERFVFERGFEVVMTILTHGTTILILFLGGKSVAISVASVVLSFASKAVVLWYCTSRLHVKMRFGKLEKRVLKEIIWYSFFILLNSMVDQMYQSTDNVIIGAFCGTMAVTTYHVGMQFQGILNRLSSAASGVYMPHIAMITTRSDNSNRELSELFASVGRFQFLLLGFAMSGVAAFGIPFVKLWAGEEYTKAYFIALIVMIPSLIPLSQNLGITILRVENKHAFRSVIYIGLAILNVVVSIPLAKRYGGIGAAMGTALACLLGQILTMNIFYAKIIGLDIKLYWRHIGRISAVCVPMGLAGLAVERLIKIDNWAVFIGAVAVYSVIFAILAWNLLLFENEKQRVRDFFARIFG